MAPAAKRERSRGWGEGRGPYGEVAFEVGRSEYKWSVGRRHFKHLVVGLFGVGRGPRSN